MDRITRILGKLIAPRGAFPTAVVILAAVLASICGCAGDRVRSAADEAVPPGVAAMPVASDLEFLAVYENERNAPYAPIEGIGGVAFGGDGALYFCDAKGGRVFGLEPVHGEWFQFDLPGTRFFRPVDVRVDGFNVLVLDMDAQALLRYEVGGAYLDRLLNFIHLDPGYNRYPVAFDVDLDGRMVFADPAEDQILTLDTFLQPQDVLGEPGSHPEQFDDPSGVAYLPDGGFVVADRTNRRLQFYNRLGFHTGIFGGEFDVENPLLTPQGLDVDDYGNIFVADPAGGAVHAIAPDRTLSFSLGSELGLLASPVSPIDVAVGPDDLLAVTDRSREAILLYRILYR